MKQSKLYCPLRFLLLTFLSRERKVREKQRKKKRKNKRLLMVRLVVLNLEGPEQLLQQNQAGDPVG